MTYDDAINYIKETAAFGSKLGLDNIRTLMSFLGDPQEKLRIIHIAGTNGKGSTAAYISSVLISSGYKVGIYSSPELFRFSERIKINDREIEKDDIAAYTTIVKAASDKMIDKDLGRPTEFELVMAMAFCYFNEKNVDLVLLEVGMGGRLDATNVISKSVLSVITKISYDHMQYLGDTLEAIAGEKAAIIKQNGRVISYPSEDCVIKVIEDECKAKRAALYISERPKLLAADIINGQRFLLSNREYITSLAGLYETDNASLAIQALQLIKEDFKRVTEETISAGIAKAVWPGRFEILRQSPTIIADGAHNTDGATALSESLSKYFKGSKVRLCVGILRDKQYREMISKLLPFASSVIVCKVPNARTLETSELKAVIKEMDPDMQVQVAETIYEAVRELKKPQPSAAADLICGSLYLVGPLREMIIKENKQR